MPISPILMALAGSAAESYTRGRKDFLERSMAEKRAQMEQEVQNRRLGLEAEGLGLQRSQLDLSRTNADRAHLLDERRVGLAERGQTHQEALDAPYGQAPLDFGGSDINVPVTRFSLGELLGHQRGTEANRISRDELGLKGSQFRYQQSKDERTGGLDPNELIKLRMNYHNQFFGPPVLGERPGQRSALLEEGIRAGQQYIPEVFGPAPDREELTMKFLESIADDSRFKDRESAIENFKETVRENPNAFRDIDQAAVLKTFQQLPSRKERKAKEKGPEKPFQNPYREAVDSGRVPLMFNPQLFNQEIQAPVNLGLGRGAPIGRGIQAQGYTPENESIDFNRIMMLGR